MILRDHEIHNVLHVPEFKFNLLSVSNLTRELCCAVTFFPDSCVFQALSNGKVMGIGKEREGLYILNNYTKSTTGASTVFSNSIESTLWHYRLRHPSGAAMQHITTLHRRIHPQIHDTCEICPLAKQHRLKFPNTNKASTFLN